MIHKCSSKEALAYARNMSKNTDRVVYIYLVPSWNQIFVEYDLVLEEKPDGNLYAKFFHGKEVK